LDEHTAEFGNGERAAWGKLLLATGGVPIVPSIKGVDGSRVFTFTTLDDAKAISRSLSQGARALVIGGGLIGLSVTEALVERGIEVTLVEMKERVLNTILDDEASAMEEETLRLAGVRIVTGHTVAEISRSSTEEGIVSGVTLDDGSKIPCGLVVVAIGVMPRIELVSGTGTKVNRGIVVDRYMATSSRDVYACGDAAESYDFVYGENRLTPIWPNAYIGGRIAGFNMTGIPTEYPGGTAMNSLKYFGLDVVSAGMVTPPDDSYEVLSEKYGSIYRRVVLKGGFVVGMVFVGSIEKSGIVFSIWSDGHFR
jgi:NAD(P)H-nitrite reductase large subunit